MSPWLESRCAAQRNTTASMVGAQMHGTAFDTDESVINDFAQKTRVYVRDTAVIIRQRVERVDLIETTIDSRNRRQDCKDGFEVSKNRQLGTIDNTKPLIGFAQFNDPFGWESLTPPTSMLQSSRPVPLSVPLAEKSTRQTLVFVVPALFLGSRVKLRSIVAS